MNVGGGRGINIRGGVPRPGVPGSGLGLGAHGTQGLGPGRAGKGKGSRGAGGVGEATAAGDGDGRVPRPGCPERIRSRWRSTSAW